MNNKKKIKPKKNGDEDLGINGWLINGLKWSYYS